MFDIQENLKKLPDKPGVYLHKDKLGQVIYVGKAISLKNRVRQYFQSSKNMPPKVRAMVSHIEEFEYITTNTEMEALILENNLIKKYMPQYNVLLRDDKTFPYIKVTVKEDFPRILKTRKVLRDGAKYFGPYTDAGAVNQIIELLNDVYSLKRCSSQQFPAGFKPCLNYHIQQCQGVCNGGISKEEYGQAIEEVISFLNGKNKQVVDHLTEQMKEASVELNFEKAATYRDYIAAIKAISEKQRVVLLSSGDMDIILASRGKSDAHIIMFFIRQGKLSGRETYHLQAMEEDSSPEVVSAFIRQHYTREALIPKEIFVETELPGSELTEEWLSGLRGSAVKIVIPQKGDKKALLDLVKKDVVEMSKSLDEKAENQRKRRGDMADAFSQLMTSLGVDALHEPGKKTWRVEAYDISNTGGVDSVGGMVVFQDGAPLRKSYRRFKIRTVEGADDYGSLQEVLYRRLKRGVTGDPGFSPLPDVLLMDGGKGQVSAVEQVVRAMNLPLPVIGMVKDDKHRTRGLICGDQEIDLKQHPILWKYIGTIQEEVHRFSVDYHRGLRSKSVQKSLLDEIPGIGEKRRNALLAHFGSIDKIKEASVEMLCQVQGINRPAAEKVREWAVKK